MLGLKKRKDADDKDIGPVSTTISEVVSFATHHWQSDAASRTLLGFSNVHIWNMTKKEAIIIKNETINV